MGEAAFLQPGVRLGDAWQTSKTVGMRTHVTHGAPCAQQLALSCSVKSSSRKAIEVVCAFIIHELFIHMTIHIHSFSHATTPAALVGMLTDPKCTVELTTLRPGIESSATASESRTHSRLPDCARSFTDSL